MSARLLLPLSPLLPQICESLAEHPRLVLVAPPGAGKTTLVPPALLSAPWLGRNKIILLEPRRLAARAAARWMATALGERVGETVGYRVHLDTVVGPRTRIEVVTEGVLTRMLQSDATLADAGAVIFDEFHERSLHGDLGLALTLHAQNLVRHDLRIVVMSATLDGAQAARVIGAPLLQSEGRAFPVETAYRPPRERERLDDGAVRVAMEALVSHEGDLLVFLPGAAEIGRVAERLAGAITDPSIDIRPLFGDLPGDAQDAAIAPSPPDRRKVVVATNIAETSLTIQGVRVVIDAGVARVPRFSPRTGLTRLETTRISRASADQRRGRAGRVAPGVCYRLWALADNAQFTQRSIPEILEADLSPLALELAAAGIDDPGQLTWLDAPPAGALAQGRALLEQLGALAAPAAHTGAAMNGPFLLTAHGRAMSRLPVHPRLAHLLICAGTLEQRALGSTLVAILGNRDILRRAGPTASVDGDLRTRVAAVTGGRAGQEERVDHAGLHRVRQEARLWRERVPGAVGGADHDGMTGVLLAFAYPDRIARARTPGSGRYLMANGTGAYFAEPQELAGEEWIVIAETDGKSPESRIYLAAPAALDDLIAAGAVTPVERDEVRWDERAARVTMVRRTMIGAIVIKEQELRDPPAALVHGALLGAVRRAGITSLPWSDNARHLRERLAFLRMHDSTWPDASDEALLASLDEWLSPLLEGARSRDDIARSDLSGALLGMLDWKQRARLDELAPTHVEVPTGSRIQVSYADRSAPSISVRLQELYGLGATPSVYGRRVALTLELLSPARRPVQVTRDLAAFWKGSYAEVRKEMRGRYPKHDWPEDPATAAPTRGRRRGG